MKSKMILIVACVILGGLAFFGAAWTLSRFMLKVQHNTETTITVKGVAEKLIDSNIGTFSCRISCDSQNIAGGYRELERLNTILKKSFKKLGITDVEIENADIGFNKVYKSVTKRVVGETTSEEVFTHYNFSRKYSIRSKDVNKIAKSAVELYSLANQGIDISVDGPCYYIDQPEKYKLELTDAATHAAYQRALKMVSTCNASLGNLLSAKQGVIQITKPSSADCSSEGFYDTTTIQKNMRIVVTLTFALK